MVRAFRFLHRARDARKRAGRTARHLPCHVRLLGKRKVPVFFQRIDVSFFLPPPCSRRRFFSASKHSPRNDVHPRIHRLSDQAFQHRRFGPRPPVLFPFSGDALRLLPGLVFRHNRVCQTRRARKPAAAFQPVHDHVCSGSSSSCFPSSRPRPCSMPRSPGSRSPILPRSPSTMFHGTHAATPLQKTAYRLPRAFRVSRQPCHYAVSGIIMHKEWIIPLIRDNSPSSAWRTRCIGTAPNGSSASATAAHRAVAFLFCQKTFYSGYCRHLWRQRSLRVSVHVSFAGKIERYSQGGPIAFYTAHANDSAYVRSL